jgi:hypothetical protein
MEEVKIDTLSTAENEPKDILMGFGKLNVKLILLSGEIDSLYKKKK